MHGYLSELQQQNEAVCSMQGQIQDLPKQGGRDHGEREVWGAAWSRTEQSPCHRGQGGLKAFSLF